MEAKIFKSNWTLQFESDQVEKQYISLKQECVIRHNKITTSLMLGLSLLSSCFHLSRIHSFGSNIQFEMNKIFTMASTIIHIIALFLAILYKRYPKSKIPIAYINYFLISFDFFFIRYFSSLFNANSFYICISVLAYSIEIAFRINFSMKNLLSYKESMILHFIIILAYTLCTLPSSLTEGYTSNVTFVVVNILLSFYIYFLYREKMTLFYFSLQTRSENNWLHNMFEYMKKGIFKLKNSKIVNTNKIISETFSMIINREEKLDTRSISDAKKRKIENFEKYSDLLIHKLLMEDSTMNSPFHSNQSMKLVRNDDSIKNKLESLKSEYKTFNSNSKVPIFKPVGIKLLALDVDGPVESLIEIESKSKDMYLDILYRFYISDDNSECFEFICDDITKLKLIEERNAEIKYKTMIFSKIAHELKNPIVGLKELIFTVQDSLNNLNVKIENINLSLKASLGLTDYLLILLNDLNYISDYKLGIKCDVIENDIDLEEISDFCNNLAYGLIRKFNKENKLEFVMNRNINNDIILKTDETKLKQILVNCISNAIKFTSNGKIYLNIEQDDSKAIFSVADTGPGMREELKNQFKPDAAIFPHIKNIEENNRPGAGLGMFIIKSITREIGSELHLDSEENKGTKIRFELPLMKDDISLATTVLKSHNNRVVIFHDDSARSSDNDSESDESDIVLKVESPHIQINIDYVSQTGRKSGSSLSRKNFLGLKSNINDSVLFSEQFNCEEHGFNIIVVDDEKLIRQGTVRMIRRTAETMNISVNILEANDGIETLYKVYKNVSSGNNIHCIISDESMNYMNGIQSADIINNLYEKAKRKKILFHIVSAYEFNIEQHHAIKSFETKPLNANIIRKILTRCIEHFST